MSDTPLPELGGQVTFMRGTFDVLRPTTGTGSVVMSNLLDAECQHEYRYLPSHGQTFTNSDDAGIVQQRGDVERFYCVRCLTIQVWFVPDDPRDTPRSVDSQELPTP